jgi:short-subunit dehydrogenase
MMRNLEEETILVTGATDGLGKRVASALAGRGATVLLHGRSLERLEATLEELRGETRSEKLRCYLADLSSLDAVRDLAGPSKRTQASQARDRGRVRRHPRGGEDAATALGP